MMCLEFGYCECMCATIVISLFYREFVYCESVCVLLL